MSHNTSLLKNNIRAFWNWFADHETAFREMDDPPGIREMIDEQVLAFGMFYWEIRKSDGGRQQFILSPNGSKERLQLSEAIVGEAPVLPHWEFFAARPPLDWDFMLEVYDDFMVKRSIGARDWRYHLRIKPAQTIRILLQPEGMGFLDEEDQMAAAQLVINNTIGEANKIYFVESILLLGNDLPEGNLITGLKREFDQLIDEW